MIKPVTFKAAQNFKANLYALEVRSRFVDQNNANGYYDGYGDGLAATVVGTSGIKIGSGALLVQGRMIEVISSETVSITYQEGKVGYIVCRIETSPATNTENCSFVARVGTELSEIELTREDTYAYASENTNKIYELPIYSFIMQNTQISNVEMLVKPFSEFKEMSDKIDANKMYVHHISFKVKSSAGSAASPLYKIFCDIVTNTATPITTLYGIMALLKKIQQHSCTGYHYYEDTVYQTTIHAISYEPLTPDTHFRVDIRTYANGAWMHAENLVKYQEITDVTDHVT